MAKQKKTSDEKENDISPMDALDMKMEKAFGKDIFVNVDGPIALPRFRTGILTLDKAMGGGLPKGRIIKIFGAPSAGKTTTILEMVAAAQREDNRHVAYFDPENTLDLVYAQKLGVDISKKRMRIIEDNVLETVFDIITDFVKSGLFSLIIIDSIDMLIPHELDKESIGKSEQGFRNKKIKQFLQKNVRHLNESKTSLITVVQTYQNTSGYGATRREGGGEALKFGSSLELELRVVPPDKSKPVDGTRQEVEVYIKKNKTWLPHKIAPMTIIYGQGVDRNMNLVDTAIDYEIIKNSVAWNELPDGTKIAGRKAVATFLKENEKERLKIEKLVYKKMEEDFV